MYLIGPAYARFVLRDFLRRDLPVAGLLRGTSLNRELLERGGNLAVGDFVRLLNNAREISGEDTIGLLIGAHCNLANLGAVGAAAATAPALREGLQAMENFSRLHASYLLLELDSGPRGLTISVRYLTDLEGTERYHSESAVMQIQNYVELVIGETLSNARYCFDFPATAYRAEYALWMHSPVSFDCHCTSVTLPAEFLDRPSPYYNAEIWEQSQRFLAQRMKTLVEASQHIYAEHVTALLRSCQPPLPDLPAIAARLHLSQRTLNRRLQQEGASFRGIRNTQLRSWARRYLLETSDSVETIAASLGYQDGANFRRAFRGWENCSPQQFRQQHGADPVLTLDDHVRHSRREGATAP